MARDEHRQDRSIALPSVEALDPRQFLTLGELRDLVATADALDLPDSVVVRGNMIPFRVADLGQPRGGILRSLALDRRPER